jgi:hypothetical protein
MRFPALLVSHCFLFTYDLAMLHISGCQGPLCVPQAVALRLCALALGLSREMSRRYTFLREQQAAAVKQD